MSLKNIHGSKLYYVIYWSHYNVNSVRDIFEAFDENTSLQFCCFKPPEHQLK